MEQKLEVTYYLHSGFSCAMGDVLCIFDYWLGEYQELPERVRITPSALGRYREIYVFVTHSHPDHFDRVIYDWYGDVPVTYIVSYELPVGARGRRMSPGDSFTLSEHVSVKAFPSTDLGVSFLVTIDGIPVFHAGDLNFWHWREESTIQEIEEAEQEFYEAVKPIAKEPIQVAFFPVDPRQGRLYEAGANYFIMTCRPKLLIPMHFWQRTESAVEFARRCRTNQTEIVAMTRPGSRLLLTFTDGQLRFVDIDNTAAVGNSVNLDGYEGEDPFRDTDMPVKMDE